MTAAASDELVCVSRVPALIWNDKGSGGQHNVSIWKPSTRIG